MTRYVAMYLMCSAWVNKLVGTFPSLGRHFGSLQSNLNLLSEKLLNVYEEFSIDSANHGFLGFQVRTYGFNQSLGTIYLPHLTTWVPDLTCETTNDIFKITLGLLHLLV